MPASSPTQTNLVVKTYKKNELPALLDEIRTTHPYCAIYLESTGTKKSHKRVLIFQNSDIGFCADCNPSLEYYVDLINQKIDSDWIDRVFEASKGNINEDMNPFQFFQRLIKFRVLEKKDIIKLQISAFLLSLEPICHADGRLSIQILKESQNFVPIEWRLISIALEKRQNSWAKLEDLDCNHYAIPILTEEGLSMLRSGETLEKDTEKLISFIHQTIDRRSNITSLGQRYKSDPLSIAQKLSKGALKGWVTFLDASQVPNLKKRARILIVDENQTTRKLLVRLLQACYDANETEGTIEAFSLIPKIQFDAIIVSHSIPLDARFQLCRIIRQNSRFKHVPIIFISNQDNFFEKAKAKMAGVTEYLTQPFEQRKILRVLDNHT